MQRSTWVRIRAVGLLLGGLLSLTALSGCKLKIDMPELIKATPTPAPTAPPTATPLPATATPTTSPTPAPRMLGSRTGSAGRVQFNNATGMRFRQVYLQAQGGEGWGRNLLPTESSIHVNENFMLNYPQAGGGVFNFLFRDEQGNSYELDAIPVTDMSLATLQYDRAQGDVYLIYQSLSEQVQKDTRATSSHQGEREEDEDEEYDEDEDYDYYDDEDEELEEEDSSKKKKKNNSDGDEDEESDEEDEDEDEDSEDEDSEDEDEEYFDIDSEDYYYYNPEDDEEEDWSEEDDSEEWEYY